MGETSLLVSLVNETLLLNRESVFNVIQTTTTEIIHHKTYSKYIVMETTAMIGGAGSQETRNDNNKPKGDGRLEHRLLRVND